MKDLAVTIEVLMRLPNDRFWGILSVVVFYLVIDVLKLLI
jgi:hypothetical protein